MDFQGGYCYTGPSAPERCGCRNPLIQFSLPVIIRDWTEICSKKVAIPLLVFLLVLTLQFLLFLICTNNQAQLETQYFPHECVPCSLDTHSLHTHFDFLFPWLVIFPLLKWSLLSCWCSHPSWASFWTRTITRAGSPHCQASAPNAPAEPLGQGCCYWERSFSVFVSCPFAFLLISMQWSYSGAAIIPLCAKDRVSELLAAFLRQKM